MLGYATVLADFFAAPPLGAIPTRAMREGAVDLNPAPLQSIHLIRGDGRARSRVACSADGAGWAARSRAAGDPAARHHDSFRIPGDSCKQGVARRIARATEELQ